MRGRPKVYEDFSGGLNLKASPRALGPKETADALNVICDERGAVSKRPGDSNPVTLDAGTGIASLDALPIADLDSASLLIANTLENDLFTSYNAGGVGAVSPFTALGSVPPTAGADPIVWAWVRAPEISAQGPYFGVGGGNARFLNGGGTALGTWTASTGTLPANATMLLYHGNRVWAAGMATDGSALVFSNLGDPRDWPAANIVRFDPGDGESITAIAALGTGIVVFKRSKAWLVYDLDTGANRPLGEGAGCIAYRSCVETPDGLIFLSPDQGFMLTTGGAPRALSENIEPLLAEVDAADALGSCRAAYIGRRYVAAFEHPAEYTIAARSEQATIVIYDTPTQSWWKASGRSSLLAGGAGQMVGELETHQRLYAACRTGRQIDRILDGSGDGKAAGTAFDALFTVGYLPLGVVRSRLHGLQVHGEGTLGVRVLKDYDDTLMRSSAAAALGPAGDNGANGLRLMDIGVAEAVRLQLYNETLATDMRVDAVTLWSTGRRD
jgi:hypothetical protein